MIARPEARALPSVRRRPRLFLLVYGATLVLALVTCLGLSVVATAHVLGVAKRATVALDENLAARLADRLLAWDVTSQELSLRPGARGVLREEVERQGLAALRLWAPDGSLLVTGAGAPGERVHDASGFDEARAGMAAANLFAGLGSGSSDALVEYLPITSEGAVVAILEVIRDARPLLAAADETRRDVLLISIVAALALAGVLYVIFRAARERLRRQAFELVEASRRDPLTGFLNHGTAVSQLAVLVEAARRAGLPVGVALIDVDHFRLFNSTHGDAAGDRVLLAVADVVGATQPGFAVAGRYGPDEFIVVAPEGLARRLEATVQELRGRLEDVALRFGGSEPLPVTVSVGIAHFPFHAASVADLLVAATVALGEAKASGGDAVRTSGSWPGDSSTGKTGFDILQGLVNAVDTKDRYTRRHSSDVARYATFLAERVDLDERLRTTIRLAGLLHDVGKIGIPDDILRKPAELTPHEYEIVQQHVAIGDLIVHGIPNSSVVRAGIRHHHERWDGTGYLEGLAAERIPLIARVLAVADAFSAMTTTRPYRKALPVEIALARIREAAGTQLDPELALVFAEAMEAIPDAPMPGDDDWAPRWARAEQVA
jgi:diguanylate cyclase (GGDEF)-like protein